MWGHPPTHRSNLSVSGGHSGRDHPAVGDLAVHTSHHLLHPCGHGATHSLLLLLLLQSPHLLHLNQLLLLLAHAIQLPLLVQHRPPSRHPLHSVPSSPSVHPRPSRGHPVLTRSGHHLGHGVRHPRAHRCHGAGDGLRGIPHLVGGGSAHTTHGDLRSLQLLLLLLLLLMAGGRRIGGGGGG